MNYLSQHIAKSLVFSSNLTSDEFLDALSTESSRFSSSSYSVLFCAVMTHGERGDRLFCSDGVTVGVRDILRKFAKVTGKPKVTDVIVGFFRGGSKILRIC